MNPHETNTVPVPGFPNQLAISNQSLIEQGYDPAVHPSSAENTAQRLERERDEAAARAMSDEDLVQAVTATKERLDVLANEAVIRRMPYVLDKSGVVLTETEAKGILVGRRNGVHGN